MYYALSLPIFRKYRQFKKIVLLSTLVCPNMKSKTCEESEMSVIAQFTFRILMWNFELKILRVIRIGPTKVIDKLWQTMESHLMFVYYLQFSMSYYHIWLAMLILSNSSDDYEENVLHAIKYQRFFFVSYVCIQCVNPVLFLCLIKFT